jgi:hypothetical protein
MQFFIIIFVEPLVLHIILDGILISMAAYGAINPAYNYEA